MPAKYNISVRETMPRFYPVGKYSTIEFREDCAGSCRECVKKRCVYDIFKKSYLHMSTMEEPEYLYECKSCFRCVQECTKGIFSRIINPEYRALGDDYWRPDLLHTTWYQAHTGKVPVSGAGYRGPFAGKGFDSMWTDMSEIVRPTRDGIHGREYINTSIELSRRPDHLSFNADGSLAVEEMPILEIPVPILFQMPSFGILSKNVLVSMLKAAQETGTKMFLTSDNIHDFTNVELKDYTENIIFCLTRDNYGDNKDIIGNSAMIELQYSPGIEKEFKKLREMKKNLIISIGIPLNADACSIALELVGAEVDTLHFYADKNGRELDADKPRFVKDMLRDIHVGLVKASMRRMVNILVSGGIALAEHVNKAIICGADGVVIDLPLLIAMECRLCERCEKGLSCPVELEKIDSNYGSRRIVNLMGAWRNQMLEMLGAMGLREVRRLRGEVGRSMWFEDLEKESFSPIFGERKQAQYTE